MSSVKTVYGKAKGSFIDIAHFITRKVSVLCILMHTATNNVHIKIRTNGYKRKENVHPPQETDIPHIHFTDIHKHRATN